MILITEFWSKKGRFGTIEEPFETEKELVERKHGLINRYGTKDKLIFKIV